MKIVWHSNAGWAPTGYGNQTGIFAPRIKDLGHDLCISAFWGLGGAVQDWKGIRTYPSDEDFGNTYLPRVAMDWAGDDTEPPLVITLMDVWVLRNELLSTLNLASWVPIDHDPIPPEVTRFFEWSGSRPIAMSRFGERKLLERGLDPLYVPHGIETDVFKPQPDLGAEMREIIGVPADAFLVGMVAANKGSAPPRKAFPQALEAFSRLQKKHPDSYLYLHSEMSGRYGIDLRELIAAFDIPPARVKHTNAWALEMGVPPAAMAGLYSSFDALMNPAYGEGFGIPIAEAQACGTPVIVTDWTAMHELCGAGWLVEGERWYDGSQRSFYKCPSVASLTDCLEQAYAARGDQSLREKSREFALAYDADRVLDEFWVPALAELGQQRPANLKAAA